MSGSKMDGILNRIKSPEDLRELSEGEMCQLAAEIRELIIHTVGKTGGHLAANLGVVELTIAMLRTFAPPSDKIVWDVSHQTYAYKILTGRRDRFGTLRSYGGISGFLRREESEYDAFGAGHSGTAISSALGMAVARDRRGGHEHVLAVLGDGSFGCGISLEGFNNIAHSTGRFIVVLNDNEMSISANVGATARYLGSLLTNPRYNRWKGSVEDVAKKIRLGWLRKFYYRLEGFIKGIFLRSVLFEEFGLRYIGPIDGHDIKSLLDAFAIAKAYNKPILLHVATQKGKGYAPAEERPEKWHGMPSFDPATGESLVKDTKPGYSAIFGKVLERLAEHDDRILAITAAMAAGTGLSGFAARFPSRFFDVGICEEHAVVFAAGLASQGMKPVFAVYSTFSQRAVDCIIHDVCLQNLPVIFCLDRAGIVGDDGPTHHGVFDISLLRPVPNLVIAQPGNETDLANMLYSAFKWGGPVVLRYPRGPGSGAAIPGSFTEITVGKAETLRPGTDIAIWTLGDMTQTALAAAESLGSRGISAGVVNARFIKPLDGNLLEEQARRARLVVTIENGVLAGGFGSAVEEYLAGIRCITPVLRFGWPDEFIPHGDRERLLKTYGMDASSIVEAIIREVDGHGENRKG